MCAIELEGAGYIKARMIGPWEAAPGSAAFVARADRTRSRGLERMMVRKKTLVLEREEGGFVDPLMAVDAVAETEGIVARFAAKRPGGSCSRCCYC